MIKKILTCLGCFAIILFVFSVIIAWQGYRFWLQTPSGEQEEITFTVGQGEGLSTIAGSLSENGLIASEFWFKVYAKITNTGRSLQAGEFALAKNMNYASVVRTLSKAITNEVWVTVPEGYTLDQIGAEVMKELTITPEEWSEAVGGESPLESWEFIATAGKPEDADLEGYLFPDTYRFLPDATAEEVVARMVSEMQEQVDSMNIQLGLYNGGPETIHEFLTLASIVEREVRAPSEMSIVAGIFENRLEIGMALQADSTVNYITGKDTPSVSLSDTEIDSQYNTYKYAGLPPGPISNPGENALRAAAAPADTSYFYFLTSPEGEVFYAETFDQHIVNRNLYLP